MVVVVLVLYAVGSGPLSWIASRMDTRADSAALMNAVGVIYAPLGWLCEISASCREAFVWWLHFWLG